MNTDGRPIILLMETGRKRRSLSAQIKEAADAIEESFQDRKRHIDEKALSTSLPPFDINASFH